MSAAIASAVSWAATRANLTKRQPCACRLRATVRNWRFLVVCVEHRPPPSLPATTVVAGENKP
jgi:hypothetical protein